ncbi:hypothetical protein [Flagellimonas meridianipacifica]|uniref:Uncharacterized protein n=1 Tax=Flagellimonas meridianipacifica TaxID=1080225 RepID=A0A2T0MBE0_9FLAO|nr:hypothetical protein [Allomuricauda pacifica]PRX54821.1 hypothetical protein CLV81_3225 [Allomuricauda pacifica]
MNSSTSSNVIPSQELLVRLERNNMAMLRLSRKLSSYTCEPNNKSCFEKLYELRQDFKSFARRQSQIMGLLRGEKPTGKSLDSEVQRHLMSFKKLESDMAAYLLDTNKYY